MNIDREAAVFKCEGLGPKGQMCPQGKCAKCDQDRAWDEWRDLRRVPR